MSTANSQPKVYSVAEVRTEPLPMWLTVKRAAQECSCSDQMINKLIHDGKLRASYIGRSVRIKSSDLLAVMGAEPYDPKTPKGNLQKAKMRRVQ
jgi:excisionase family DNA binding protein